MRAGGEKGRMGLIYCIYCEDLLHGEGVEA